MSENNVAYKGVGLETFVKVGETTMTLGDIEQSVVAGGMINLGNGADRILVVGGKDVAKGEIILDEDGKYSFCVKELIE
ncbi:hypothetical protein [Photobacterium damselae]|uniref:hypothetical protein n=1 Tax=Photobacterium damselae TaxID=38293 RepID=UPI001F4871C7|nr:hypothetical protein [Photobacterium damselae]UKA04612.1 hypothetical protein IHC89_23625 [Photobacterium damselae subsp. damselae]